MGAVAQQPLPAQYARILGSRDVFPCLTTPMSSQRQPQTRQVTGSMTVGSICPLSSAVFSPGGSESGMIGSDSRRVASWGCQACNRAASPLSPAIVPEGLGRVKPVAPGPWGPRQLKENVLVFLQTPYGMTPGVNLSIPRAEAPGDHGHRAFTSLLILKERANP